MKIAEIQGAQRARWLAKHSMKESNMRVLVILGVLMIVLGIVALGVQGVTFFTQERAVDAGPLKVDVSKPHTIIFHPVACAAAVAAGLVLVVVGARAKT
jgi:hypothetical protein